jgi:predicted DNA-binding transcriptional regulator YafY
LADLGADQAAEAALLKLSAALPSRFQEDAVRVRQRLHLDPAGWFQMEEPVPFLPMLQQAVWEDRRVRMTYRRGDGTHVERVIEPYGLVAKAGIWYVVARSFEWVQVFRVSRILEAEPVDSTFPRPDDFDLAGHWRQWCDSFERTMEKYHVTLRVSPIGGPLLVKAFGEGMHGLLGQAETEPDSTNLLVVLTFSSAEDACRKLLGLGDGVEVTAPPELRQLMYERAAIVAGIYAQ